MINLTTYKMHYILQNSQGTRWCFYLTENNKIMYTVYEQGAWSTHKHIDSQLTKKFSATIDKLGVIRLIVYTQSRQLLYYEFARDKWHSQVVERLYSRFQDISFLSIKSSSTGTHILYYINHSLSRSGEVLVHYYLQNKKWHGGQLWKFMSDQKTNFESPFIDHKGGLHILFKQKWRQRFHIYHSSYKPDTLLWSEPSPIHSSSFPHNYKFCIDKSNRLHVVWREKWEGQYQIRYMSKILESHDSQLRESIIHNSPEKIILPIIMEYGPLYCFWREGESIYKMASKDLGANWSAPKKSHNDPEYQAIFLNYIFVINDTPNSLNAWGIGYPNVKIIGIEEYLPPIENKKVEKNQTKLSPQNNEIFMQDKEWKSVLGVISSIRMENEKLKEENKSIKTRMQRLDSMIYNLQEQIQVKEKTLFNLNAQIKQLNFQIKQLQLKSRQISSKVYSQQEVHTNALPIVSTPSRNNTPKKTSPKQEESPTGIIESEKTVEANIEKNKNLKDRNQQKQKVNASKPKNVDKEKEKEITPPKKTKSPEVNPDSSSASKVEPSKQNKEEKYYKKTENKETERITLGNTVILINPKNPEDF